jgi:hypothetical protein
MRSNEGGGCGSYGFISSPITNHEPDSAGDTVTVTFETRRFVARGNDTRRGQHNRRNPERSAGIQAQWVKLRPVHGAE